MSLINTSIKSKIIVSIVGVLLIFVGYYLAVFLSFSYQSNNQSWGSVLMVISTFILLMLWIPFDLNSKFKKYALIIPMVIISISIVVFVLIKKKSYLKTELSRSGIIINGKIIGFEIEKHKRNDTEYATFIYSYKNKKYTQRIAIYDEKYVLNQKIGIRISKNKPEMFEILN